MIFTESKRPSITANHNVVSLMPIYSRGIEHFCDNPPAKAKANKVPRARRPPSSSALLPDSESEEELHPVMQADALMQRLSELHDQDEDPDPAEAEAIQQKLTSLIAYAIKA